jgi:hypothetical protein
MKTTKTERGQVGKLAFVLNGMVRQPAGGTKRLAELSETLTIWHADEGPLPDEGVFDETIQWIDWTLQFLQNRALYHKKQQVKKQLIVKMAQTLLSEDELQRINELSEEQLDAKLGEGRAGDADGDA